MKLSNSFLLLAALASLAFYSCNFSQGKQMKFVTHKEAADTELIAAKDTVQQMNTPKQISVKYVTVPTEEQKSFLHEVHLDSLIVSKSGEGDYPQIYNGFFGADHYRIEFYVGSVQTDSANPFVLYVTGKDRFKKTIIPFTGKIMIDSLLSYRDFNYGYSEYLEYKNHGDTEAYQGDTFIATCHIKGTFELLEDSNMNNSGVYSGNIFIDVARDESGGYDFWFNTPNETRRGGLLMDGIWTSNSTKEQKPVIAARDLFMFANDILEDFSYGEREIEINKKYRAQGWDNYWENDEWWSKDEEESKQVTMMIWNL